MVSVEFKEKKSRRRLLAGCRSPCKSNLGQPCCTLSGISSGLITMPGDFAVVIHGSTNVRRVSTTWASVDRFFCVGLNEADFTSGDPDKLEECLELVVERSTRR